MKEKGHVKIGNMQSLDSIVLTLNFLNAVELITAAERHGL